MARLGELSIDVNSVFVYVWVQRFSIGTGSPRCSRSSKRSTLFSLCTKVSAT